VTGADLIASRTRFISECYLIVSRRRSSGMMVSP